MEEFVVRYARKGDALVITENNISMAKETEDKDLDPKQARLGVDFLLQNQAHGFYLVVQFQDQVVGQLMITYEWSDWRNGLFWWIQSVYVQPNHRKKGVFRKLYRHLQDLARSEASVCGLRLYAHDTNQKAMKTYISVGMQSSHYVLFEEEFQESAQGQQ